MPTSGPFSRAVTRALKDAPTLPRDAAAVQLAKQYATLIDAAAPLAKYDKPLAALRRAVADTDDPAAADAYTKVADALAAHSVASDLGPKLLAALTALGMTAAGRGAKGGGSAAPVASRLDELRARRRQRTG